jgi:hypothetical protein
MLRSGVTDERATAGGVSAPAANESMEEEGAQP